MLRSKVISLVKVLWKNHEKEAATWDPEVQMRRQCDAPNPGIR